MTKRKVNKIEKTLSRCVVGGINGKPVTVCIGDKISVLFVQVGFPPYWDLGGVSEVVKIIKSERDQYIITIKLKTDDEFNKENTFYTSNNEIQWYRLFHIVEKFKKSNKGKEKCNTL